MLTWIQNNIANLLIILGLLAIVITIISSMVRNKKRGRSPTCMGCSGCPSAKQCRDANREDS